MRPDPDENRELSFKGSPFTKAEFDELEAVLSKEHCGGKRKSRKNKSRKSRKNKSRKSRKTKSRKSKSHKK